MKPSSNADKNYHALYSLMMAVRNVLKIGALEGNRITEVLLESSRPLIFAREVLNMLFDDTYLASEDKEIISSFQAECDAYLTHLPWIREEKSENVYYIHNAFSALTYDRVCAALGPITDDQLYELTVFNRNSVWEFWNTAFKKHEVDVMYQLTQILLQPLMHFASCDLRDREDREELVLRITEKFPKTLASLKTEKANVAETAKPRDKKKKGENSKPSHEVAEPPSLDTNTAHASRSAPRVRQSRQSGRTASNSSDFGVAED